MNLSENLGTFKLDHESLIINQDFGVSKMFLLLISGVVTIKGTSRLGGRSSEDINLETGVPLNFIFGYAIDGLVIDATNGVAILITGN